MLIPLALFVTYTTFGPIAQDDGSLYVADQTGSIVRVDKNNPSSRTTLTTPTGRRIAAIDIDGDRVYYGTAPAYACADQTCSLTDTEADHDLFSASVSGGDEQLFTLDHGGFTEIQHDDEWVYWIIPSPTVSGAQLNRTNKATGEYELIAAGLTVPIDIQHPFVLAGDSIYVSSGTHLLRVPKSGGTPTAIAVVYQGSSITAVGDTLYFVGLIPGIEPIVSALDLSTGTIVQFNPYPLWPLTPGPSVATGMLGAAPGFAVVSQAAFSSLGEFLGWTVSDLCTREATLLGSTSSSLVSSIPPLSDPPIAVDSIGVYMGDRRVLTFARTPASCGHNRAINH